MPKGHTKILINTCFQIIDLLFAIKYGTPRGASKTCLYMWLKSVGTHAGIKLVTVTVSPVGIDTSGYDDVPMLIEKLAATHSAE